ncbi:MAG: AMP-dependent synthetase/ligase [Spirochaetota bacterium]
MFTGHSLPELFLETTGDHDRLTMFNHPHRDGWISYTGREVRARVAALAHGIRSLGVERGATVGLIAPPSPDWIMIDLAIQIAGGVTVPIFKKISPESFVHEIDDSAIRYLFIGNPEETPFAEKHAAGKVEIITFGYTGRHNRFDDLLDRGRRDHAAHPERLDELCHAREPDELATILYTSGTTGLPKGVELTQRNITSQVYGASERFRMKRHPRALSALPLAHIFERTVMYYYFALGAEVFFVENPKELSDYVKRVRPEVMTVVPRILEKVHDGMVEAVEAKPPVLRGIARAAVRRAETRDPERTGLVDRFFDALVYKQFRAGLGGRFEYLISGSAKLDEAVARFTTNIGIPVYEGYGLTESSPVIAANCPGNRKLGTVGKPFPDIDVRIAEDGEVLARGPNIMRGYHNDPEATAETIEDGWLHTGDLGEIDEDGFLTIKGRKKNVFKKSTGEYVQPGPIERALEKHQAIDTAVIVADGRPYVVALLFPDPEQTPEFKRRLNAEEMADEEFLQSALFHAHLENHVEEVNRHQHHAERVERFAMLPNPATAESGELTPTLKPRRSTILDRYSETVAELYAEIGGWK